MRNRHQESPIPKTSTPCDFSTNYRYPAFSSSSLTSSTSLSSSMSSEFEANNIRQKLPKLLPKLDELPISVRYPSPKARSPSSIPTDSSSSSYMGTISSSSFESLVSSAVASAYNYNYSSSIRAYLKAEQSPQPPPSSSIPLKKQQYCCITCREKELREERDKSIHHYENLLLLKNKEAPRDAYALHVLSAFWQLEKEKSWKKITKLQKNVENILCLNPRKLLAPGDSFQLDLTNFGHDLEIRLCATRDVSPEAYQRLVSEICQAIHFPSKKAENRGIRSIFSKVKRLFRL